MMPDLHINGHEGVLIVLAWVLLYAVLAYREMRWSRKLLLVACICPALVLALEGTTELLTNDETYMIGDIIDLPRLSSRQWSYANYHTSIALIGNIVSIWERLIATAAL